MIDTDLLEFYPKFDYKNNKQKQGFHACLFKHKDSKQYTLAIRGSYDTKDYLEADFWNLLTKGQVPQVYYENMLRFYNKCVEKYPDITQPKSLNITGYSLGGCLAQLFALNLCNDKNKANINEVYTFNSPGAKNLKPPYDLISNINEILDSNLVSLYKNLLENYKNRFKHKLNISNRIYHIQTTYDTDAINNQWQDNLIQNLGVDIVGNHYNINTGIKLRGAECFKIGKWFLSHSVMPATQTLYFYSYLLESSINDSIFLYSIEVNKALQEGDYDDNNPISVNNPPHWLYATIDKTLFEATSKTNDNKKLIKNDASDVIDGILYLQDNEIYIKILSKNEIININISSPLANLFALHEAIFFTSVDKAGKPLISNNEIANKLIGYITPRTQIFCNNLKENSKDVIIKCYINKTLEYYPESIK
ncbi:lipase family protein [Helicobacter saguini]|uniref:lipase family protein n=2 Tax=Helicobacter saguini TaxID=1548018 RepID=UPI001F3D70D3|nr:Mbeg1-like protein [Helicobacter saguini]